MSPRPTFSPLDADQDVSVPPVSDPNRERDACLNPTPSLAPASGKRDPETPLQESHPSVPSDRFVGVSTHTITIEGVGFLSVNHRAVCSCGWAGSPHYNDYDARMEGAGHLFVHMGMHLI